MFDLHLTEDGGSVIRHRNFSIGGDENFVQSWEVCVSFPLVVRVR